jgi:DNA-binding IclR family transcriptional regulator
MPRTRCAGGSSWLEAPSRQGVRSPARSPRSSLAFAEGGEHTLTEIARLTGLPVSTAHRLTAELASWRMLERTDEGLYRAGLPLRVIGTGAARPPGISERAPCVLEDLVGATRSRARLGAFAGLEVAYMEKQPGRRPVSGFTLVATLPAHRRRSVVRCRPSAHSRSR